MKNYFSHANLCLQPKVCRLWKGMVILMAYLSTIIEELEKKFEVKVNGIYDKEIRIETIQFLTDKKIKITDTYPYLLFITDNPDISLPTGSCVLIIHPMATSSELNVLIINKHINLFDVHNVIQHEVLHSLKMQKMKEEMFNVLQTGGGIKGIITIANTFLENPITVCDTNFSILEIYPEFDNDIDFEKQGKSRYLKIDSIKSLHKKNLVDKIFQDKHAFQVHNEISNLDIIFCSIRIDKLVVGYVCIVELNKPFSQIDFEFTEVMAKMISVEMQKSGYFIEKSSLKYESFLKDLLEGRFDNFQYVKQRLQQLGYPLTKYHYVITFSFSTDKRITPSYYVEQINLIFQRGMCMFYKGHPVLFLFSDKISNPFSELESLRLEDFIKFNQLHAAISYPFSNTLDAPLHYRQSLEMLELLPLHNIQPSFLYYEDYCLSHIFTKCGTLISSYATIHPDILLLKEYDEANHTEYLTTLRTYLNCDRNAVKSSKKLNIHKSTFFYRVSKISDLLDITFDDCKKLFLYELSFHIMHTMHE